MFYGTYQAARIDTEFTAMPEYKRRAMRELSPTCDKIWYQKLRRVNKFGTIKEKQRRRKNKIEGHREPGTTTPARWNAFKENRRGPGVQVYRLAFYSAELHGGSLYGPGLFCSSLLYLSNNIPCGYTNSHLQIQNAVHHNRRTKAYLHTRRNGKMLRRPHREAPSYTYFNKYWRAGCANKQTDHLFVARLSLARVKSDEMAGPDARIISNLGQDIAEAREKRKGS